MANTFKQFRAEVVGGSDTIIVPEAGGVVNSRARAASSVAIVHSLFIANIDGTSSVNVDITTYDGTTSYYIGYQIPVPASSTLFLDKVVTLETLDRLRVRTTSSSDISVVASVLERT